MMFIFYLRAVHDGSVLERRNKTEIVTTTSWAPIRADVAPPPHLILATSLLRQNTHVDNGLILRG